jgi:hypothetical protein
MARYKYSKHFECNAVYDYIDKWYNVLINL